MSHLRLSLLLSLITLCLAGLFFQPSFAQVRQSAEPLTIDTVEPYQFDFGVGGQLTIIGTGFHDQTVVRLVNYGLLTTTVVNNSSLTAIVPPTLPVGYYVVQLVRGAESAEWDGQLYIRQPASTPNPTLPPTLPPTTAPTEITTATMTPTPSGLTITNVEPARVTQTGGVITLLGQGFTPTSYVRLVNYGALATTFINGTTLTAIVPPAVPLGQYEVQVAREATIASWNGRLAIYDPTTATPIPTNTPAPTPTPSSTPLSPLTLTNVEPAQLDSAKGGPLTIFGSGFIQGTVIRLVGYGILSTTFVNETSLSATVPLGLDGGAYTVEVVRNNDVAAWSGQLQIINPASEQLLITAVEPATLESSRGGAVSILGSGFTQTCVVRLIGYGVLSTTYLNANTLSATIPVGVRGGSYELELVRGEEVTRWGGRVQIDDVATSPLYVSQVEPTRIDRGVGGTITLFGGGFAPGTVARLVGHGILATTVINETTMTAVIPSNLEAGEYPLQLVRGEQTTQWQGALGLFTPATATPSGGSGSGGGSGFNRPNLLVQSSSTGGLLYPGQTFELALNLINVGNKELRNLTLVIDAPTVVIPSDGSNVRVLSDIGKKGSGTDSLSVIIPLIASQSLTKGQHNIKLNFSYSDPNGNSYTSDQLVGISLGEATATPAAAQKPNLILSTYETTGTWRRERCLS